MKNLIKNHPVNFQLWTFIWLIVAIVTAVFSITSSYNSLDNKIDTEHMWNAHIVEVLNEHDDRLYKQEERINENSTSNSKIEVELQWIKAILLEIKESLK